ncbi:MAG: putative DNA-binding domain-containing protein [Anaerolineae bacterium]|nr:putative DNA-binding domain-containing protein [Anaerolineae bacterium]
MMAASSMRDSQLAMARFLRDPDHTAAPAGVEQRRLNIYRDLVYNNIDGFIRSGFPVLCSLYTAADWDELVRAFVHRHRCQTPYFLEISREFLQFLLREHSLRDCDPPFMAELAHYEWVELALDVATGQPPEPVPVEDVLAQVLRLSPLAWSLCYRFPVHRVGPRFRPAEADEPTYLVVYRDRADAVCFMAVNAATSRLLELLRDNDCATGAQLLAGLADEMDVPVDNLLTHGGEQLRDLLQRSVIGVATPAASIVQPTVQQLP